MIFISLYIFIAPTTRVRDAKEEKMHYHLRIVTFLPNGFSSVANTPNASHAIALRHVSFVRACEQDRE